MNDPWAVGLIERGARAVLGPSGVGPTQQSTGGEDFSWYLDHAPGGYFRLGVRTPGAPVVDIHAGNFDVDERAIALGARVLAATVFEALADLTCMIRDSGPGYGRTVVPEDRLVGYEHLP